MEENRFARDSAFAGPADRRASPPTVLARPPVFGTITDTFSPGARNPRIARRSRSSGGMGRSSRFAREIVNFVNFVSWSGSKLNGMPLSARLPAGASHP
jgi:hypothetical protein